MSCRLTEFVRQQQNSPIYVGCLRAKVDPKFLPAEENKSSGKINKYILTGYSFLGNQSKRLGLTEDYVCQSREQL